MTGVLGVEILHGVSRTEFDAQLRVCGFYPEPITISTHAHLTELREAEDHLNFMHLIGDVAEGIYRKPKALYLPLGILVLLITKQLGVGFQAWLRNRIKSFTGAIGLDSAESFWDPALLPSTETAMILHRATSSNFHFFFFKFIFNMIFMD